MYAVGYGIIVTGRVQGVGFRDFVARTARSHDWRGEVWNRRDGSVELIVETDMNSSEVRRLLSNGPGRVDVIEIAPMHAPIDRQDFRIGVSR